MNRFVSGHGFMPCCSPVNKERGLWLIELTVRVQGLKPGLFCALFGATEVVP
jgi:hypothetical protein